MKTEINVKFEGTFEELCQWAPLTFKDPTNLQVKVEFGQATVEQQVEPDRKRFTPGFLSGVTDVTFDAYLKLRGYALPWTRHSIVDLNSLEIQLKEITNDLFRAGLGAEAGRRHAMILLHQFMRLTDVEANRFLDQVQLDPARNFARRHDK